MLACLMLLVLTIAVLTTVNIGHTVHEKIRLQNNADATSYSMAAMEARAFNFYAFANRTQVSHYVGAMVWQSLDSFIFFLEAFLTDIYGMLETVNILHCDNASGFKEMLCTFLEGIPIVGPVIKVVETIIGIFGDVVKFVQSILKNNIADEAMATIVSGHRILNQVLDAASVAMMYSALQEVADPISTAMGDVSVIGAGVAAKNDANLGKQLQQIPLALLNACYFDRAHFREAGGSPFAPGNPFADLDVTQKKEDQKVARAKRTMAQIANATRFGCDTSSGVGPISALCPDSFVTDRRLGSFLPKLSLFGGNAMGPLVNLLNTLPFWGQTRLLTYHVAFGQHGYDTSRPGVDWYRKNTGICGHTHHPYRYKMNHIRDATNPPDSPMGMLAQGDNMGADDIYFLSMPPANIPFTLPFPNPFDCDKEDDWNHCWGDNRVRQDGIKQYQMPMKTSVWALNSKESPGGGVHWRVQEPGSGGPDQYTEGFGLNKKSKCLGALEVCGVCAGIKIPVYTANVQPVMEKYHKWNGVVRFPHFEPGQYAKACLQGVDGARNGDPSMDDPSIFANDQGGASSSPGDFNQPSEWVLFHKSPADMRNPLDDNTGGTRNNPALLNDKGELTFHFTAGGQKLTMDDQKDTFGFVKGVTAFSRAQTYYHRPGNWYEQPNFFNPYWRPRLASVWQGRKTLPFIGDIAKQLPGPLKAIPQKVITH